MLIKDVADVRFGGPVKRGDGNVLVRVGDGVEGGSAVMLAVQKQPDADTLKLDRQINVVLDELQRDLAGRHRDRTTHLQAGRFH